MVTWLTVLSSASLSAQKLARSFILLAYLLILPANHNCLLSLYYSNNTQSKRQGLQHSLLCHLPLLGHSSVTAEADVIQLWIVRRDNILDYP
jgi:hypothetical protein